ncbi:helix-turn-helix transcriptional regulator [Caulobacter sp. SL161]|uniref:helix-turn-helix domain-containing protein n=1 Tax=Caulobacter sp. SL161 TaxID=2995156 RepID=UPI002272736D|nr:helix-turn-helix transcriptional regulator [Caulobacter sp. SL161]MCY1646641.1 helix-turn-helix transcriptional regulator [Caulobacter sp. SL161]
MARAALGWSVRDAAERSGVADSTIHRFEANKGGMQTGTLDRLQRALEEAGVIFLSADANGGPGVRLRS